MNRIVVCAAALIATLAACRGPLVEPGVSRELAQERSARVSELRYGMDLSIPDSLSSPCEGSVLISFQLKGRTPLQLDWRPGGQSIKKLEVNGIRLRPDARNEHIVLPRHALRNGRNEVWASFVPEDATLNRHQDYLYTLLVPERARTLFPCFDQPDLKARFSLELDIPSDWIAVSNGPAVYKRGKAGRLSVGFKPSEPVSTYLFEICAGRWEVARFHEGRYPVSIHYRETDPAKVAQLPDIYRQISSAIEWMEEYTGIPMPFLKYDCVIVPGFQFGGMEHPGAILYNEGRMFLPPQPTDAERLSRMELIAHETAHLWFGDAVTMQWFDDVWTKEVFANHFAAMMCRPEFPDIDFRLQDFRSFNIPAYAEDRTAGSTPIRQQLGNLQDAGLVYGNIVYDKAPVVMRMLADTLGPEAFRSGLKEYLQTYLYGNATWPALIEILDSHTDADLAAWSRRWVEEKGMPEYPESDVPANLDALGYGYYPLTDKGLRASEEILARLAEPYGRLSTLANLFENMLRGRMTSADLCKCIGRLLAGEQNQLVAAAALGYLNDVWRKEPEAAEKVLLNVARNGQAPPQVRLTAFRSLIRVAADVETIAALFEVWKSMRPWPGISLSDDDYTTLACELAVRRPADFELIGKVQRERIANADKRARFDFVFPAAHPSRAVRDSVFTSLLEPSNRLTEPWVQESLRLLNHPLRQSEALDYIVPTLDEMQEIQRTGDIFFPKNWISSVLSGHSSHEAATLVRTWLASHPDYPPLLLNKILQSSDHLLR